MVWRVCLLILLLFCVNLSIARKRRFRSLARIVRRSASRIGTVKGQQRLLRKLKTLQREFGRGNLKTILRDRRFRNLASIVRRSASRIGSVARRVGRSGQERLLRKLKRQLGRGKLKTMLRNRIRKLAKPLKAMARRLKRQLRRLPANMRRQVRSASRRFKRLQRAFASFKGQVAKYRKVLLFVARALIMTLIPALKGVRLAAFARAIAKTIQSGIRIHRSGKNMRDGLRGNSAKIIKYLGDGGASDARDLDRFVGDMFEPWVKEPSASILNVRDSVAPFERIFKQVSAAVLTGFRKGREVATKVVKTCNRLTESDSRDLSCTGLSSIKNVQKTILTILRNTVQRQFETLAKQFLDMMVKRMAIAALLGV